MPAKKKSAPAKPETHARKNHGIGFRKADGRFFANHHWIDKLTGEKRKTRIYGRTEEELEAKRERFIQELAQTAVAHTEKQTVGQFLTTWLENTIRPHRALKTYLAYEQTIRLYLAPGVGHILLGELRTAHVQQLCNAYTKRKLSKNTVRNIRAVLRVALNAAMAEGFISLNPAERVNISGGAPKAKTALTAEQAVQFLAATKDHRLSALWSVALSLAMRQGEIIGLTWDRIDFAADSIKVDRQVQRVDGQYHVVPVKSNAGRRDLTLPEPLLAALRAHRDRQSFERGAAGDRWAERGLVFCTPTGGFLHTSSVTHITQRELRKAGLPELTFHELRHSAATLLGASGLTLHEIADILGHTDVRTSRIYVKSSSVSKRKAADAMAGVFGEVLAGTKAG